MDKLRSFYNLSVVPVIMVLLLAATSSSVIAATAAQVYTALDSPPGVTVTALEYIKYVMTIDKSDPEWWLAEIEYDYNNDGYKIENQTSGSSSNYWTVQRKSNDNTTIQPIKGDSCVYSSGVGDACAARIKLLVRGPGTLTFKYKTSCDFGDSFNYYLDGYIVDSASGYDDVLTWEDGEITIFGGLAEAGATKGTYNHEIILEFFKDETEYEGKTPVPDGPLMPKLADFFGDIESYNLAMQVYREEMKYFKDRIWIDDLRWEPAAIDVRLEPDPNPINELEDPAVAALRGVFEDEVIVQLLGNVEDFGYHLRYTTDGTVPTANSPAYNESQGIILQQSATITAKAFDGVGRTTPIPVQPEIVISGRFQAQVAAPVLTIDQDASTDDEIKCLATCTTDNATIYYTFANDGTPNLPWPASGLLVAEPRQIRAVATRPGTDTWDSEIVTLEIERLEAPTVSVTRNDLPWPDEGLACNPGTELLITITAPVAEAIFWSDEAGQATNWQKYHDAFSLLINEPVMLQVRARQTGKLGSAIISKSFYPAGQTFAFTAVGENRLLHAGWNLLSMPFSPTPESMDELLQQWPTAFAMDKATGAMTKPAWISQGEGFWLFCETDEQPTLQLTGAAIPNNDPTPDSGWCLQGPTDDLPLEAWIWQPEENGYSGPATLKTGQGGWIFCQ